MLKIIKLPLFIVFIILIFVGCKTKNNESISDKEITLKSLLNDDFYIGAAINQSQIEEKDSTQNELIKKQFNSITAENHMKSLLIHPEKDRYDFDVADKFVALGLKDSTYIQGHTLVWHSQLSPFFKEISDSTEMINALTNHINTIVGRYKAKVNGWDVVNEALNDDGSLRKTPFLETIGEDYLALAFQLTAKADPDAELYYNDYSMTNPRKRAGAIAMIKKIQQQGVKIDGVGMQGHWSLNEPTIEEIEQSILDYASLGIKVAITELDISVIPMPWDFSGADVNVKFDSSDPTMNPYAESLPDSIQDQLAQRYQDVFKLFLKHKDKISRVTLWGVNDGDSWKNNWPIQGRTDYPLLFDRNNQPKKAYYSIIDLKEDIE